jgi:RimJ/RimL family protein N-acetyltransferase
MKTHKIKKATNLSEFLFLRKLRNSNRHYMTGSNRKIRIIEQILFWLKKPSNIEIYIIYSFNLKAGYLLINRVKTLNFITEVVDEKFRNKGLGESLIKHAKTKYSKLIADIYESNIASIKIHKKMGFIYIGRAGKNIRRFKYEQKHSSF